MCVRIASGSSQRSRPHTTERHPRAHKPAPAGTRQSSPLATMRALVTPSSRMPRWSLEADELNQSYALFGIMILVSLHLRGRSYDG
eukprot:5351104-Prymnesium_polylepis.1